VIDLQKEFSYMTERGFDFEVVDSVIVFSYKGTPTPLQIPLGHLNELDRTTFGIPWRTELRNLLLLEGFLATHTYTPEQLKNPDPDSFEIINPEVWKAYIEWRGED